MSRKERPSRWGRLNLIPWLLGFLLCFSSSIGAVSLEKNKLTILASVFPLFEFCQAVVGEHGQVELLLPAGVSPHDWQPRFSELVKLQKADVLAYIGESLEPWVKELVSSLKTNNLNLLSFEDLCFLQETEKPTELDPHIWLDFRLDGQIIERLGQFFSKLEPNLSAEFAANAASYASKLQELDSLFQTGLGKCPQRTLIIDGHGAFSYLAKRYGLKQISLQGLNPEAELRPAQLRKVLELIKQEKIKAIFFEAGSNPRLARRLSEELQLKVLPLHPGHNLSLADRQLRKGFLDLMKENLKNIREGLGCE